MPRMQQNLSQPCRLIDAGRGHSRFLCLLGFTKSVVSRQSVSAVRCCGFGWWGAHLSRCLTPRSMEYMQAHLLITGVPGLAAWPNEGLFKVATSSDVLFLRHCLSVSSVLLIYRLLSGGMSGSHDQPSSGSRGTASGGTASGGSEGLNQLLQLLSQAVQQGLSLIHI